MAHRPFNSMMLANLKCPNFIVHLTAYKNLAAKYPLSINN